MSPLKITNKLSHILNPIEPTYWREDLYSADAALQKMFKNSLKAIEEHQKKSKDFPLDARLIIPVIQLDACPTPTPLKFTANQTEFEGLRESMEDACFTKEISQGFLAGVFDGHGGASASDRAKKRFSEIFENHLLLSSNHIHYALEKTMEELHKEIIIQSVDGTTAVVCYIEQKTNRLFTATLGDSEAHIYRLKDEQMHSIPASCVRDWTSAKDAKRYADAKNDPLYEQFLTGFADDPQAKEFVRFKGLNVSRALGDRALNYENGRRAVIQKPKITVHQLLPGDIVTLACDGLKDFVPETVTARTIHNWKLDPQPKHTLSDLLVTDAIQYASTDNITVVAIHVEEQ
jgi:serine/threonine protein phosphatase PrpC